MADELDMFGNPIKGRKRASPVRARSCRSCHMELTEKQIELGQVYCDRPHCQSVRDVRSGKEAFYGRGARPRIGK